MIRVSYPEGFLGAPVIELPAETAASVFSEMDEIAAKLRAHPQFIEQDLQTAFYRLQRKRIGERLGKNLSREDWLWLFGLWCEHDRGQQVLDDAERDARLAQLSKQREELLAERAVAPPQHYDALTAQLMKIGTELAALQPRHA
jgi:hypothetical protein